MVPAAGQARRMGGTTPKQYLQLAQRSVIEWALAPFLEHPSCEGIVVVIAADDRHWPQLEVSRHPKIRSAPGGLERMDSVRSGLQALAARAQERDWVLVHDAARPCLAAGELDRLIGQLRNEEVGGLLAIPVVDTLKRADADERVSETVSRTALWRALTPQMFRYGVLERALTQAAMAGQAVTDEAQAVEALGLKPRLVRGDPDNIKITLTEDLARAELVLRSRGRA
ncbi:MAG TPA: 2-C-methyl-D-erythritol 4-phosphate cytidylyltransferase [Steroidobacter sp.]